MRIPLRSLPPAVLALLLLPACERDLPRDPVAPDTAFEWTELLTAPGTDITHLAAGPAGMIYAVATDSAGARILHRSGDHGLSWERLSDVGHPTIVEADRRNASLMIVGQDASGATVRVSLDGGMSIGSPVGFPGRTISSAAFTPKGRMLVGFAAKDGRNGGFACSNDDGASWAVADLSDSLTVAHLLVHSSAVVAAYTHDAGRTSTLYLSQDAGFTWSRDLRFTGLRGLRGLRLGAALAYIASSETGLFRSTDNGSTWASLGFGPGVVGSFEVSPSGAIAVSALVGGQHRLFHSADGGATWVPQHASLFAAPVRLMIFDTSDNLYVVVQSGRIYRTVFPVRPGSSRPPAVPPIRTGQNSPPR